jgi:hypothetical protein
MFTQIRIGRFVAFETASASAKVRCQVTRQGCFQSSAVGAGHIASRETPCGSAGGEPCFTASGDGSLPPPDCADCAGGAGGAEPSWAEATAGRKARNAAIAVRCGADRVRMRMGTG